MPHSVSQRPFGPGGSVIFGVVIVLIAAVVLSISETSHAGSARASLVARSTRIAAGHPDARSSVDVMTGATVLPASDVAAARATAARVAAVHATATRRTIDVWTAGFQAQINECHGGVDVTAHYGERTVAEHWQCGGSALPTASGTLINITGLDAGTYRVVGVVATLNAYTARTSQIPRGYDLLLQTCLNDDSHHTEFIALTRVDQ
ncbi:MAG TPA: hypothetical protein VHZ81_06160 [Galbitalea sp.]|nr:hypothetical protein [Galbitalea sp.]